MVSMELTAVVHDRPLEPLQIRIWISLSVFINENDFGKFKQFAWFLINGDLTLSKHS